MHICSGLTQPSFLKVNYQHSNFSISQCTNTVGVPHIVAISDTVAPATTATTTSTSTSTSTSTTESPNPASSQSTTHSLSTGTTAGIAIAIIVIAIVGAGLAITFMVRRRRQKRRISEVPTEATAGDHADTPLCYQRYTSNGATHADAGSKTAKGPEVRTYELAGNLSQETIVNSHPHERVEAMTIELSESSVPPSELPSPAPTWSSPDMRMAGSVRTLSPGLSPPSSDLESAGRAELGFFDHVPSRRRSAAISPPRSPPLSSPGLSSMHSMPSPHRWDSRSTTVSPEPPGSRTATPSPEPMTPRSELPSPALH